MVPVRSDTETEQGTKTGHTENLERLESVKSDRSTAERKCNQGRNGRWIPGAISRLGVRLTHKGNKLNAPT
jgi:hypothetical protein